MAIVTELDLPVFDYADPALVGDRFHETMDGLRDRGWVAAVQPFGHVVLDHEAVDAVVRTPHARMPAIEILELQGVTSGPIHDQLSRNLINLQGEEHRRLRGLVQAPFLPRAVEALRPAMRRHLAELLDPVRDDCELVSAVAKPYPARMIAEIVGAPVDDAERLGEWAYWIQATFDPAKVAGRTDRIEQAAVEVADYVGGLLEDGTARTGLIGVLRDAVERDEISGGQAVALLTSVLAGGVDTTQAQLAHAVRLLATHPEQWAALRADPALAPAAVEEVLRFEPIAPFTARLVVADLIHRGVTFPAGSVIFACAASANRDPLVFDEPGRFDITADRRGAKILTFGAGPHFCLGAALARAELDEALALLADRFTRITLTGAPDYDTPTGIYGLHALPVRFEA